MIDNQKHKDYVIDALLDLLEMASVNTGLTREYLIKLATNEAMRRNKKENKK